MSLTAANGTSIATYGEKSLLVTLGLRRQFRWIFVVADVSCAILGIDFLSHFRLQVDIAARRITDTSTSLSVNGIIDHASVSPSVSLPRSDDESISLILAEFPALTNVSGNLRAPL